MRGKIVSFLLTIAMVTSLFDLLSTTAYATTEHWTDGLTSDTSATYSGGTGTSEDPFILKTAQDLAQLSVNVSPSSTYSNGRYFKLDEDVNLSGKLWTPIAGNPDGYHNGFSGNFNGNGHVIIGITVDDSEDETKNHMTGFFGWTYNAVIYDLGLEDISIISSRTDSDTYAGAFVGYADCTTVTNCYATGSVNGTGGARAGGFVGQLYNDTISNCFFSGSVASTGSIVGGFVAIKRGTIQNCWCATSTTGAGFVASSSGSGSITNCYYDKTMNPSGTDSLGNWEGKTTEELKSAVMVALLNGSQSPAPWKRDVSGKINAGYPVLSWVDIPPILVGSSVWRSNGTTATVRFMSNKAGTCWYQITDSITPPTDVVSDGTDGGAVTADTAKTLSLTGLTDGAKYVHLVVKDDADNVSDALTVSMPYDYYYYENFESYPLNTFIASNEMAPLHQVHNGTGDANQKVMANMTNSVEKMLSLSSTSGWASDQVVLLDESALAAGSSYVFEGDVYALGTSGWQLRFSLTTGTYSASTEAGVFFENGNIFSLSDSEKKLLTEYTANQWYHVKIEVFTTTGTYAVYVDDTLLDDMLTMPSGIDRLAITSGHGFTAYYDNLEFHLNPSTPAVRYAVTFNQNHGTSPAERTYYIEAGTSVFYDATVDGNLQTLEASSRPGYVFGGWYKETACENQMMTADAAPTLCASTDYTDASAFWTKAEAVTLYAKWLEMTPAELGLDYDNEQITGLAANTNYSISGTSVTADANGKAVIQSGWFDTSLSVLKKGAAANSSFDSATATLIVPARPAAPTGLAALDETYSDAGDGKITGVADTLEYKLSIASDWTAVSSGATEISGLDDGTYYVRYRAVTYGSQAFASEYTTVTVGTTGATPETQPSASVDYADEKLTGLVAGAAYDIGGTAYTANASGDITILNNWFGTTIGTVKKGNGTTTTNSASQILALADRPAAPSEGTFTLTQPTASVSTGTIAGITSAMEYSADGGSNWTVGSGADVSNLAPGDVLIRIKATDTAPKSASLPVTIISYQAPTGGGTSGGSGGTQDKTENVKVISEDGSTTATGTVKCIDNGLSVTIPSGAIDRLAESGQRVTLETGTVTVGFDTAAMEYIDSTAGLSDVILEIVRVDAGLLSEADRQLVGDHPVYDFSVKVGNAEISDFGGGTANVGVPYTLSPYEDLNAIVVYYLSDSGTLETMRGMYNAETGMVEFSTKHFSKYAVVYNKVIFTDVAANAWYEDGVTFLAARGITIGTGDGTFSPDVTLTRGQFIMMLMRSYGIEADVNPADNFTDAGNTYYTNYLTVAKRLGISNGTGDNRFEPDIEITRQDMFTLLYRTLDVLGELPEITGSKTTGDFNDAEQTSDYAKTAINTLVGAEIISGSDGKLNPMGTTTRSEMAQVLYHLMRKS